MKRRLISFLICSIFSLSLFSQSTIIDSINSGGIERDYRLYVPAIYDGSEAVPLILNLHGYTSDNFGQDIYANFHPIADTANFLILSPNGTFDINGDRFWNCFVEPGIGVDDVQFLSDLIDSISSIYNIDADRIYSTGMSNGGFMSYALACELSSKIAAIASVAGSIDYSRINFCDPQHNTPVMQIHGTADFVVPFNGSIDFLPIDSVIQFWVDKNHCDNSPVFNEIPDIVPFDGCTAEHYVYGGCYKDLHIEFYKIIDGGHTWPGTAITFLGVTNLDMNACKEIWRFFSQYRLSELTELQNNNLPVHDFHIYPNPVMEDLFLNISSAILSNEIIIFDINGKEVYKFKNIDQNNFTIETYNLNPGYYLFKYSDERGSTTLPFIKE